MQTTRSPKAKSPFSNPIERLHRVGSSIGNFTKEEAKQDMTKFWEQLLGVGDYSKGAPQQGNMTEGEAIFFSQRKQAEQLQQEAKPAIRAAYNYSGEITRAGETNSKANQEIQYKLKDIIGELQRLAVASVVLQKEVVEATGQTIVNPGKYHINFFEWLLIEIRQARIQVEDASSWLVTVTSKQGKRQKQDYWNMYKKYGTKFGLSGERSVSTQTA